MNQSNKSQAGFSVQLIVIIIAVTAIAGVLGWRFVDSTSKANVSQQTDTDTKKPVQLSPADAKTLEQANELKKVDHDLDGVADSQDTDDDNDGVLDTEDTNNDEDDKHADSTKESELQAESEHGDDE